MTAIIISLLVGLILGGAVVYLICKYSKSIKHAAGISGTALLLAGSGLGVYYNGQQVPTIDVHAKMIPETNGDNYFPDQQVYPGWLAISQLTLIPPGWPKDTTIKAYSLIDSQRVTFKKRLRQKIVELRDE